MKHIFLLVLIGQLIQCKETENMNTIKLIHTKHAPEPIGPYSQAIQVSPSQLLFISGQIPLSPYTAVLYTDPTSATEQVMKNLHAILQEAGMDFSNVVKTTIYLTNMADFSAVNAVYQSYFEHVRTFPARETVQVAALPKGSCIEISMIAAK